MDVLKVDGKNYVKASVIARDLGYTADYVGQLCRSGRVDAKLFGRSWYVDEDSIHEHKGNRYRSTQAVSVKAIQAEKSDKVTPKMYGNSLFYRHNRLKPAPIYNTDDSDLLPALENKKKAGNLRVDLADAIPVAVSNTAATYTFETPKLPDIKFSGELTVTEFDVTDPLVKEGGIVLHPKSVEDLVSQIKPKNIASSANPVLKIAEEVQSIPKEIEETAAVVMVTSSESVQSTGVYFTRLIGVALVSLFLVAVLHTLEAHIFVTPDTLVTKYVFEIDHLLASVQSANPAALFVVEK